MTELQSPQRRSYTAKAIFGLLLAVVMVAAFATAGSATGSPRSGQLHVEKECSQFSGLPGGFCTITGSNLNAIDPGMKVVYTNPHVVGTVLSSDLYVDGPGNNDAYGHVDLDLAPGRTVRRTAHVLRRDRPVQRVPREPSTSPATSPTAALVRGTDRTASPHPATTNKPKRNP